MWFASAMLALVQTEGSIPWDEPLDAQRCPPGYPLDVEFRLASVDDLGWQLTGGL